jgi:hypothetical protein
MRKSVLALWLVLTAAAVGPAAVQARTVHKKKTHRITHAKQVLHRTRKRPLRRKATAANAASPFSRYKDSKPTPDQLLNDPDINGPLKSVLHKDYNKLVQNMQAIDYSEPLVNPQGVLVVRGGVPHLEVLAATYFSIEPNGKICAAIQDSGEKVLYYSNDPAMSHQLSPDVERWRAKFASVPVVYKSK